MDTIAYTDGLKGIDINMKYWIDLAQDKNYWRALVNGASLENKSIKRNKIIVSK